MANIQKAGNAGTMAGDHPGGFVAGFPGALALADAESHAVCTPPNIAASGTNIAARRTGIAGAGTGIDLMGSDLAASRSGIAAAREDIAFAGSDIALTRSGIDLTRSDIAGTGSGIDLGRSGIDVERNRTDHWEGLSEIGPSDALIHQKAFLGDRRRPTRSGEVRVAGSSRGVPAAESAHRAGPHPPIPARGEDAAPTSGDDDVATTALSAPILNQTKPKLTP